MKPVETLSQNLKVEVQLRRRQNGDLRGRPVDFHPWRSLLLKIRFLKIAAEAFDLLAVVEPDLLSVLP